MVSVPPTDSEYDQRNQHDDFVYSHDNTCCQRCKPQFRRILLHIRHFVHAGLLHCRLNQVRVGRTRVGDIRLCLQAVVHRVAYMDKLLHFLELIRYLGGFRLIEVVRVRADAVRYVGEKVEDTPVASTACHARIGRWIPPAQDDRDSQGTKQFHHVQRLVLHHHLIRHACRHHDSEQGCQCHTHLQDPPVTPTG